MDAFGPEGGGGSTSTEGAGATGATSSAGGDGVGASGAQSTGGASAGGAGAGGASSGGASAGGGGSDPSGGGGAGGDCGGNHFLRFTDDSALVVHDDGFNDMNDFAFGARLRIGYPAFEQAGLQSAYVFGKAGAWALHVLETAQPSMVNLEGTVVVAGNACHVTSASVPLGTWVSVRVHYKREDNPDLHVVVEVDGMAAQPATFECGNAEATTTTSDVEFGAAGGETAYFGDLDDVYFKDKEEPFAGCDIDGSTDFHFDFETDFDLIDGIDDDCPDAIVMLLDALNPPTLACE